MNVCTSEWLFAIISNDVRDSDLGAVLLIASLAGYDPFLGRIGCTTHQWDNAIGVLNSGGKIVDGYATSLAYLVGCGYINLGPFNSLFLALPEAQSGN
jgi:hypothetical protein